MQKKQNRDRCSSRPNTAPSTSEIASGPPPAPPAARWNAQSTMPVATIAAATRAARGGRGRAAPCPPASVKDRDGPTPRAGPSVRGSCSLLATPDGTGVVHHRHAHAVAILGPGAIVVAHVVTEDLLQREPGMRGTLADPAVGDHGLAAVDAHRGVDLAQL